MLSTVTTKGQVTLPKTLRERLGIVPGTRLDISIDAAGNLLARPVTQDATAVLGLLHRPDQAPVSLEEMDDAIAEAAAGRDTEARQRS